MTSSSGTASSSTIDAGAGDVLAGVESSLSGVTVVNDREVEIRLQQPDHLQRLVPIVRYLDRVSLDLEIVAQAEREIRIVLDDEYGVLHPLPVPAGQATAQSRAESAPRT